MIAFSNNVHNPDIPASFEDRDKIIPIQQRRDADSLVTNRTMSLKDDVHHSSVLPLFNSARGHGL